METSGMERSRYEQWLCEEEKSPATIVKYSTDVEKFRIWARRNGLEGALEEESYIKDVIIKYKAWLKQSGLKPASVNVSLAAINSYMRFLGYSGSLGYLKVQKKVFQDERTELTMQEYRILVETARFYGNERLALVMETMASTGMRVSELQYITVETVIESRAVIDMKNKIRTVFLPRQLCSKLRWYARGHGIDQGRIFITSNGLPMSRKQVWDEMKKIGRKAGIDESKVFPHNLRHLFARTYYRKCGDIVRLADILGHSNMNTTRIYLAESGSECERQINNLGIVS